MRTAGLRFLPGLLLLLGLAGCFTTWHPTPASPRVALSEDAPATVRVITSEGTSVVVRRPRIIGDSIVAVERRCRAPVADEPSRCTESATALLHVDSVTALELPRTTVWPVVALTAVAVGALAARGAWCSAWGGSC